jgi:hypothetical protein
LESTPREHFDIILRPALTANKDEEMYRVTIFKKVASMDELIQHPEVARLIKDRSIRIEKLDNYRFNIYLQKL